MSLGSYYRHIALNQYDNCKPMKSWRSSLPSLPASARKIASNPARLFRECGETLPFGCHQWMIYEPEFWKARIEQFGYKFPEPFCRDTVP